MARNLIVDKFYANLIKSYIKKNILVFEEENSLSPPQDIPISNSSLDKNDYESFLFKIKEINAICRVNNESNFMTDLIVHLVKTIYNGVSPSTKNNNYSNISNEHKAFNVNQAMMNNQTSGAQFNNNALSKTLTKKIYVYINDFLKFSFAKSIL